MDKDIVAAEQGFLTPMSEEENKEEVSTEGGIDTDIDVNAIAQDEVMGANSEEKAEEAIGEEEETQEVEETLEDSSLTEETAVDESIEEDSSEEGELSLDELFSAIDELGDAPDEKVEEIQEALNEEGVSEEITNQLEELKTTLVEREQKIGEIETTLNMYKSKLEEANDGLIERDLNDSRIAPYIDVLEENDALKAGVVYLAKYEKNGNEGMKEQAIDALYDFLSTETGHDIKGMIEKDISKESEGLENYEGGAGELEKSNNGPKTLNLWG